MKLAKYHRGDMFLPVDTFRRSGQEIVLTGMIHVAPAAFYDAVRAQLDAHAERGDRVLVEGIRYFGDDAHLNEHDQELIARYKLLRERSNMVSAMIAEATGMTTQLAAFPDWFGWEHADITALEMMQLREIPAPPELDPLMESEIRKMLNRPRVARAAYGFVWAVPALVAAFMPVTGFLDNVTIGHRNRVAILHALRSTQNAILPWGAGHLPGMGKLLERNGFEHVSRRWNLALPGGGAA